MSRDIETVKCNNLLSIISEIQSGSDEVEEELMYLLSLELQVTTVIIPMCPGGAAMIPSKDGRLAVAVFTSEDECPIIENFDNVVMPFIDIVNLYREDENIDGILIDSHSVGFFIPKDYFGHVLEDYKPFNNYEQVVKTKSQLKQLRKVTNPEIIRYLSQEEFNYEDFIEKLTSATLFTLLISSNDLNPLAEDGIIDFEKIGFKPSIFGIAQADRECLIVFTGEDKINHIKSQLKAHGENVYLSIVPFEVLIQYCCNFDYGAIILNFGYESIMLTREDLLALKNDIIELSAENKQEFLSRYAFTI